MLKKVRNMHEYVTTLVRHSYDDFILLASLVSHIMIVTIVIALQKSRVNVVVIRSNAY
jgi:hypothetical protein